MAKLSGAEFLKRYLGNLTVYKMKGIEQPVVRRKGGPKKEQVRKNENFENTRRRNSEFGARSKASRWIMLALHEHKTVADYNIAGPLNSLMIPLQNMDNVNHKGQRAVQLSANPQLLKGFSLNKSRPFDTVLRTAVDYKFGENNAQVSIPALVPDINFFPAYFPWFRIVVSLGLVPDLFFMKNGLPVEPDYDSFSDPAAHCANFGYAPSHSGYESFEGVQDPVTTPWHPVKKGMPLTLLDIGLDTMPPAADHTLILSIGIQYGIQQEVDVIDQAPHAGAAKILALK